MQMKQWAEKKTSVFCTTVVTYKYAELWHILAIFITTIKEIEGLHTGPARKRKIVDLN